MSNVIGKKLLLAMSAVLMVTGGAMLYQQWTASPASEADKSDQLTIRRTPETQVAMPGHFTTTLLEGYSFSQEGKDLFKLQVVEYQDDHDAKHSAVLFPKDTQDSVIASTPTGLRHEIWRTSAELISRKAPENALFLSWWDDGQRIHFLSGKDAWLSKPSEQALASHLWQSFYANLPMASSEESERLAKMARWLTMDSDKAISEIAEYFGNSRPIYLLVNNDLLLHLPGMVSSGGTPLILKSKNIPAGGDLHGDIAQVKRWAYEEGKGNYLAQNEGRYYRVWTTPDKTSKNSLLVRLLPFVDSLKKLPEGVSLVYQSRWGGFLSIYKIEPDKL